MKSILEAESTYQTAKPAGDMYHAWVSVHSLLTLHKQHMLDGCCEQLESFRQSRPDLDQERWPIQLPAGDAVIDKKHADSTHEALWLSSLQVSALLRVKADQKRQQKKKDRQKRILQRTR